MNNSNTDNLEPAFSPPSPSGETGILEQDELGSLEASYEAMQRSVRRWGLTLLPISLIFMFSPEIYRPFYVVLIFLGLLAIFYRSSFVWIITSVYILTEAVTQLLLGAPWTFTLFWTAVLAGFLVEYHRHNAIERQYIAARSQGEGGEALSLDNIGRRFGLIAAGFGWIALFSSCSLMIFAAAIGAEAWLDTGTFVNLVGNSLMEFVTLGLAFGVACLLTKTRHRLLALAGIIPGVAVWLFEMYSVLFLE